MTKRRSEKSTGEAAAAFPVLRSKLAAPQVRHGIAPRLQLLDRLREGRGRTLTLVCAPAGYGKTTLLAQWLAADAARTPFVWLSVDEGDADPIRLWSHVIAGLRAVHPRVGASSAEGLRAGPRALPSVVLPLLAEELSDAPASVLVVDDWHRVRNPVCDDTMRMLVESAPASLQLVLSTRADPSLPVGRWRAHDELVEVRAAELRLSHVEAAALLHEANADLDPDDVSRLTERTEGWAAGLHLAALLLRDEGSPHDFVAEFSGDSRHVLEYLSDDVLRSLPDDMRSFLLRVSVLDEVSGAACDAVLETSGSAATLAEIERANLFLTPIDRSGEKYRFHQLFAEALRRELAREEPHAVPELHARASTWFEAQGDLESAVEHAIASRDAGRASSLVVTQYTILLNSGRLTTLVRWLDALSWPDAKSEPQLAIVRAAVTAQMARPAEEVELWLEVAARGSRPGPLDNGIASLESGVALIRALYLTKGVEAAVVEARRAVELETEGSPWRRQALLALGQALYLDGDAAGARRYLVDASRQPGSGHHALAQAVVLAYLALAEIELEALPEAERHALRSLATFEERHVAEVYVATPTHLALAGVHAATADVHAAIERLELAVRLSAPAQPSYWHALALLRLAALRHRLSEADAARAALESARADLEAVTDSALLNALLETVERELTLPPRHEGFYGEPLSESELRVLRLLVAGRSISDVARELYLAPTTVKTHRRTIYRKLGVTTREAAAERTAELGIA